MKKRQEESGKALLLNQQGGVCPRPGSDVTSRPTECSWSGRGLKGTTVLLGAGNGRRTPQLVTSPDLGPPKPTVSTFLTALAWLSPGPTFQVLVGKKAVVPKRSSQDLTTTSSYPRPASHSQLL